MSSERQPPDDHELEDFLHGSSRIGAAYREAARQDSAPRELDAAILNMAREAVAKPAGRRPRWIQPIALAATLVLSLGVLLNIWSDPAARRQLAPMAESVTGIGVDSAQPETGLATGEWSARRAAPVAEQKPAVPEQERADAPPVAATPELRRKKELAAESMAAPASPPAAPAAMADESAAPGVLSPPESIRQAPASAPADANSADAPTVQGAGAMAPDRSQGALRSQADSSSERDRAAKAAAPTAEPSPERAAREEEAAADRADAPRPELWIETIRARLARGDEAGTRAALKAFRKSYPDFVLPDELKPYDESIAPR